MKMKKETKGHTLVCDKCDKEIPFTKACRVLSFILCVSCFKKVGK